MAINTGSTEARTTQSNEVRRRRLFSGLDAEAAGKIRAWAFGLLEIVWGNINDPIATGCLALGQQNIDGTFIIR